MLIIDEGVFSAGAPRRLLDPERHKSIGMVNDAGGAPALAARVCSDLALVDTRDLRTGSDFGRRPDARGTDVLLVTVSFASMPFGAAGAVRSLRRPAGDAQLRRAIAAGMRALRSIPIMASVV